MKGRSKRIVSYLALIVAMILIISLVRDIWRLLKAGDRVELARTQLAELEKENRLLKEKRDYYQSSEFIEQQARDKLNLSKEGETVVILPDDLDELMADKRPEMAQAEPLPNWRQWWNLFF